MTHVEILEEHHSIEEEDIKAALFYAAQKINEIKIVNAK